MFPTYGFQSFRLRILGMANIANIEKSKTTQKRQKKQLLSSILLVCVCSSLLSTRFSNQIIIYISVGCNLFPAVAVKSRFFSRNNKATDQVRQKTKILFMTCNVKSLDLTKDFSRWLQIWCLGSIYPSTYPQVKIGFGNECTIQGLSYTVSRLIYCASTTRQKFKYDCIQNSHQDEVP